MSNKWQFRIYLTTCSLFLIDNFRIAVVGYWHKDNYFVFTFRPSMLLKCWEDRKARSKFTTIFFFSLGSVVSQQEWWGKSIGFRSSQRRKQYDTLPWTEGKSAYRRLICYMTWKAITWTIVCKYEYGFTEAIIRTKPNSIQLDEDETRFYCSYFAYQFICVLVLQCPWACCQIRKIAGCACAGNAGNVFPATAG